MGFWDFSVMLAELLWRLATLSDLEVFCQIEDIVSGGSYFIMVACRVLVGL